MHSRPRYRIDALAGRSSLEQRLVSPGTESESRSSGGVSQRSEGLTPVGRNNSNYALGRERNPVCV